MNKKLKNKQEKGITLIALVVTIIIMLILAGVSIKLAIDNNGIIENAKEAKDQYEQAQANDESGMGDLASKLKEQIDANKNNNSGSGGSDYDPALEGVPIPAGFYYVGGTKASGLVISDNSSDKGKYKGQTTVGTDLVGNQFVWIPVDNIADYKRTAYSIQVDTGTIDSSTNSTKINYSSSNSNYYTEAMPSDEKTSVEKNKGYYIGRYEAGDKESTDAKTLRSASSSTSNTITIKAKQAPYNYIKYTDAKALAEGFGTKQNYKNVKTKLASSYAWDTAIAFIQKTVSDYGSSSNQGNYKDTTFTYTGIADKEKNKQTKANGTGTLIPTGQTTGVCNIYDMGGNVWEWTTESCSYTNGSYIYRGGIYVNNFADFPAGSRGNGPDGAYVYFGFRSTLFL